MRISNSAIRLPNLGCGDVAQTGEHLLCKQGVSGSIPLISTKRSASMERVAKRCSAYAEIVL